MIGMNGDTPEVLKSENGLLLVKSTAGSLGQTTKANSQSVTIASVTRGTSR